MTTAINTIIEKIRNPSTRWEGIIEFKELKAINQPHELTAYCDDQNWIIRWIVLEKMGDIQAPEFLHKCFEKLSDPDAHVRANAEKALNRCVKKDKKAVLNYCNHKETRIRNFCIQYISDNSDQFLPLIEQYIAKQNWIIANKLVLIVFQTIPLKAEPLLLSALSIKHTQKHAIMMLAILQSSKAIPRFIALFETPSLKRHIIQALKQMDPQRTFPQLIQFLAMKSAIPAVKDIIQRLDTLIVGYLIESIHKEDISEQIIELLKKMTITAPLYAILEKKTSTQPQLNVPLIDIKKKIKS